MKPTPRSIADILVRAGIAALVQIAIIVLLAVFVPGFRIERLDTAFITRILIAAFVIGGINLLIGPALIALRVPINFITAGGAVILANVLMLGAAVVFVPGLDIDSIRDVWLGAIILSIANTILTAIVWLDDDYSFFQFTLGVRRSSMRASVNRANPEQRSTRRGMVLLEIDGLSYERMQRACDTGLMPTVATLIQPDSHCLSQFDCGLPSQTSACQAGILFGNNLDIPAFRWYDKRARKMYVSNHLEDAAAINDRSSNGKGLLRGGVSINNLINGDAARSLLTLSTLTGNSKVPTTRAIDDLNAFWLNPYTFFRAIALSIVDLFRELAQGIKQRLLNTQPRINRLHGAYPFLRVITNVFLRDLATYAVLQEILRGTPVIYTTFVGYDEVAHHAGPDTPDAMRTLRGYDKQVRHVLQTIEQLAPMPYDLFILSDHGQTVGATFLQRSGKTLRQTIDDLTGSGTQVGEMQTTEAGQSFVRALMSELKATNDQLEMQDKTRIRRAAMKLTMRGLDQMDASTKPDVSVTATATGDDIVVCASGCLAHVYFNDIGSDKASLTALESKHPGLIHALVNHPDIGFVLGYDDEGHVILSGKRGARDLSTGAVNDEDPLLPFGNAALRAEQLLRLAQFESAGDLIINSSIYADGSVAAFEELVGSHGGLGGQQTHAFILHPCDTRFITRDVSNSADMYALLEGWKGLT
jgi:uncharacterized membrane protein YvlD (DUF360 family)/polyhydroxyalkanoate synthesis regulator phasin